MRPKHQPWLGHESMPKTKDTTSSRGHYLRLVTVDGEKVGKRPLRRKRPKPAEGEMSLGSAAKTPDQGDPSPSHLEVCVLVMEEHLAATERAVLILAHSLERQRTLLEEIKAEQGWRWKVPAPTALYGDAVLFRECDVRVVPRNGRSE